MNNLLAGIQNPVSTNILRVTFLALVLVADIAYSDIYASESGDTVKGRGSVTYVVDGDTLKIQADSNRVFNSLFTKARAAAPNSQGDIDRVFNRSTKTFTARIGNIDTAESVHPDESRNSAAGTQASSYAKQLIGGKRVSFFCWDTGYYLRPICSVVSEDQDEDFATNMINAGYSTYVTKYGNHPFWHKHYDNL